MIGAAVLLICSTPLAATAKMQFPFPYKGFDSFPASFFGADIWGVENSTEMALVAKHQVSGWGWQQGCMQQCCSGACNCETSNPVGCPDVPPVGFSPATGHAETELPLHEQAVAFRKYLVSHTAAVTQGVFVYRQLTNAVWWWAKNYAAYTDPGRRGFFLTAPASGEYCWASGPVWDFRNASAREYYLDRVIGELTNNETDGPNMVFFDGGLGWLAGHLTLPGNCSNIKVNFTDEQRMEAIEGYLEVMNRGTAALNAKGMIPIFSNEAMFDPVKSKHRNFPYDAARGRQFTELGMVEALANVTWMRGYEFFQAYGWSEGIGESIANMIQETQHGVPVVAHAYGAPNNCSDPLDKGIGIAVAAFLLAQGPYTYFQTSSSVVGADPWTDAGWCWHPLYDLKCGHPIANASQSAPGLWTRQFTNCNISLDQNKVTYAIQHNGRVVSSSSM